SIEREALFISPRCAALITFGFEHFPVGPGMPVLLVYGEVVYRAVRGSSELQLYSYEKVALPESGDGVDDAELAPHFRVVAERALVIWPEVIDGAYARALRHAALLADAGVAAVGIVG